MAGGGGHDEGNRRPTFLPVKKFSFSPIFFYPKIQNLGLEITHFGEFGGKIEILSTHCLLICSFLRKFQLISPAPTFCDWQSMTTSILDVLIWHVVFPIYVPSNCFLHEFFFGVHTSRELELTFKG